jgi:Uma2 family endonuclease
MASASIEARAITHDTALSFEINPGTLLKFLESRAEKGPRLKCFEGSVTLVSPGMPHEINGSRLSLMMLAICFTLGMKHKSLRSTTWFLPLGAGDTAYEADAAYYIQSHGKAKENQPPDLAIEIVVSNPATKALRAGAFLKIPELWVFDVPSRQLTFYHLSTRGKHKDTYQPKPRSRAFPVLTTADVLGRLDDLEPDAVTFHENCREWARRVLVPRCRPENGGG